jgi:hypothetical protein
VRKLLALAVLIAVVLVLGTTASAKSLGGWNAYQCNVQCSFNAYQYGDGAYRNIFNGCCRSQSFYAPYSGGIDGFAHWNGRTLHVYNWSPGGVFFFSF